MSVGWARKTEPVPALMVRDPAVERMKGLALDPILPAAVRVRLLAVMAAKVRVVVIEPADAVKARSLLESKIGAEIEISPVVCKRNKDLNVPERGR